MFYLDWNILMNYRRHNDGCCKNNLGRGRGNVATGYWITMTMKDMKMMDNDGGDNQQW